MAPRPRRRLGEKKYKVTVEKISLNLLPRAFAHWHRRPNASRGYGDLLGTQELM